MNIKQQIDQLEHMEALYIYPLPYQSVTQNNLLYCGIYVTDGKRLSIELSYTDYYFFYLYDKVKDLWYNEYPHHTVLLGNFTKEVLEGKKKIYVPLHGDVLEDSIYSLPQSERVQKIEFLYPFLLKGLERITEVLPQERNQLGFDWTKRTEFVHSGMSYFLKQQENVLSFQTSEIKRNMNSFSFPLSNDCHVKLNIQINAFHDIVLLWEIKKNDKIEVGYDHIEYKDQHAIEHIRTRHVRKDVKLSEMDITQKNSGYWIDPKFPFQKSQTKVFPLTPNCYLLYQEEQVIEGLFVEVDREEELLFHQETSTKESILEHGNIVSMMTRQRYYDVSRDPYFQTKGCDQVYLLEKSLIALHKDPVPSNYSYEVVTVNDGSYSREDLYREFQPEASPCMKQKT